MLELGMLQISDGRSCVTPYPVSGAQKRELLGLRGLDRYDGKVPGVVREAAGRKPRRMQEADGCRGGKTRAKPIPPEREPRGVQKPYGRLCSPLSCRTGDITQLSHFQEKSYWYLGGFVLGWIEPDFGSDTYYAAMFKQFAHFCIDLH